ncbi:uncharacterized protein F5891DRAFT_1128572 [Suillus fuscotomentosus]|uniref:Uncharacterized protein n=1 Tax=Suillus fuscotomentosus TaxID=1912939 RepID=A0AAD4HL05_9AGAM|nr:uncharacterized protein F5891DRAFT_1128572 [Suillus fuscotomentosus]KAG1900387.1 hypothetical protein F5891DRAFT_1128572 [Suillus fuscotomentosus]
MRICHVSGHDQSKKHQRAVTRALECVEAGNSDSTAPPENSAFSLENITGATEDDHLEVPIGDLWDSTVTEHTIGSDYYEEILAALRRGESLFSCPLEPLMEEIGVELDNDLAIEECITQLLFSSPHTRFLEAQKRAVLDWATALGAKDVPTLYSIKKTQDRIRDLVGNPTEKVCTKSGTVFYLNSVAKAITKDYGNPLTQSAMRDYPEEGDGRMSQVHHSYKMMHDLPDDLSPPTVRVGINIFFVDELLQLSSMEYFIPKKFFEAKITPDNNAQTLALGHIVVQTDAGFSVDPERVLTPVLSFVRTFEDIKGHATEFECGFTSFMVLTVPLIVFMDDVSGNISKQWNKHHVVYMSNAALPHEMLEKEFCVRFVSSSPHATPMELMCGFKESIVAAASDGIITWDCKYNDEVMLAEVCSHGGLKCNYFCRTCKVGGTTVEKKSDNGYLKIFKCGELQTPEGTKMDILKQIELSKLSGGTEKVKNAVSLTVSHLLELGKRLRKRQAGKPIMSEEDVRRQLEQEFEDMLHGSPLEDHLNPLLGMPGVNIHQDTPTEILHTILLGIVKYFWGQTAWILDKGHLLDTFEA